ncbi:MAG: chorismate-binding protein, partial [Chrysiogenetes bacterium]|nr:chorismate-binding protein [Chrysiogenetes bacterium]
MPPGLVHPELAGDFARQSVQFAAERAALLRRPVLAVLPMATPYIEPVEWLRLELGSGELGCYLGSQEEELACAGATQVLEVGGDACFADARAQLRTLFSDAVFALPFLKRVARAFCTFAFSKQTSGDPWAGMPQNLCVVPGRMLLRRRGTVWGAQLVRVAPDGSLLESDGPVASLSKDERPEWTHETWLEQSAQAIARIRAGELEKVVLVRREAREIEDLGGDDARGLGLIEELRARHPRCTVYWVGLPGGQSFIGATPEQLVRVSGRRVSTMALA